MTLHLYNFFQGAAVASVDVINID